MLFSFLILTMCAGGGDAETQSIPAQETAGSSWNPQLGGKGTYTSLYNYGNHSLFSLE